MNETLDPNTSHSELIFSEGNEHVAHRQSRSQTSYSDLTASSLRWARRGSSQEGGYKKRSLGTGQCGSWVLPRTVSWRSHLCVNWERVRAVSCYGNEYWAISSPHLYLPPNFLLWNSAPPFILWSPTVGSPDIFPAPKRASATPPRKTITLDSGNQDYILSPSSFLLSPTAWRGLTRSPIYLIKRL